MELLSFIPIAIISFLPILLWGYIFSYLDNSPLGARRFGLGIIAGVLSVVPVLFMGDIMTLANLANWNIFPLLLHTDSPIGLTLSLLITIGLIATSIFIFSLGIFSMSMGKVWKTYIRNTFIVVLIGILFSLFHVVLFNLNIFESPLENG